MVAFIQASRFSGQLKTGSRQRSLILVWVGIVIIVFWVTNQHHESIGDHFKSITEGKPELTAGKSQGPPTYETLKKWEDDLPQHDLDAPFPEGRTGRYIKFSNQIKMLGWNNVFNEL